MSGLTFDEIYGGQEDLNLDNGDEEEDEGDEHDEREREGDKIESWLEGAPADTKHHNPELVSWTTATGYIVCWHCAGRIVDRGFFTIGWEPRYTDQCPHEKCDFCERIHKCNKCQGEDKCLNRQQL